MILDISSCQVSDCEELHEAVASLKQQVSSLKQQFSEALENQTFSPVVSNPERATETKSSNGELSTDNRNATSKEKIDALLLQAQVFPPSLLGLSSCQIPMNYDYKPLTRTLSSLLEIKRMR